MIEVNSFLEQIKADSLPYVLLFWGSGCSPCDAIKPVFDKVEDANRTHARFLKFRAADQYKLAGYFKVIAIPSLVYVKQDGSFNRLTGPKTYQDIESFIHGR